MCLAQGHNAVTPVRFKPTAPRSGVKHSTTANVLPMSVRGQSPRSRQQQLIYKDFESLSSLSSPRRSSIMKSYQIDRQKHTHRRCTITQHRISSSVLPGAKINDLQFVFPNILLNEQSVRSFILTLVLCRYA